MALVEEGVRQQLRQRFSHLPEPVFNECLRTNPSNLDLCIIQLRERSQAQAQAYQDPMLAVQAGMDPARLQCPRQLVEANSLDGRENSDDWVKIDWPPAVAGTMQTGGGDGVERPPNRTHETDRHGGDTWQGFRNLYNFKPPQVSKLSVNLQDRGRRAQSPLRSQISDPSPTRTERGSGSKTPSTPDSSGLDTSILLPDISPPATDRTPSPTVNQFFPPIDPQALRASQSNGRSSPGAAYANNPGNSSSSNTSSPRHAKSRQIVATPSTQPSQYNSSQVVTKPPLPAVVHHNPALATSHPVTPHQRNSPVPGPDVRRKTPTRSHPETDRWADPYIGRPGGAVTAYGHVSPGQGSRSQDPRQTAYVSSPEQEPPRNPDELAYNQALIMHQNARKERLKKDLTEEKAKLERMRAEIQSMERDLNTKRASRNPFPTTEQLSKLREEKRQMQIDIECMNKEIDMFRKQGLTYIDTQEQQYFYENIISGPTGPIPAGGPPAPPTVPPAVLDPDEGQHWSCQACTFHNHPFLDKCECCEMPRDSA